MGDSRIIVFSFLLYTCFAAVAIGEFQNKSETSYDLNNKVARDPKLVFLGKVGSKSFYLDSTPRSWEDSVKFCASQGMNISRIETTQQGLLLASKLTSRHYWLDGRDSGKQSQYEFSNGEAFTTNQTMAYHSHYATCVTLYTSNFDYFQLSGSAYFCSTSLPVICQIFSNQKYSY